jgi:2-polyprenyl-6-methoxyphenol hydroxylase-like FAD-dependent oxidoreductase
MLPRDESAAYALDDAILFARVLAQYIDQPLQIAFEVYESLRRDDVSRAFKASRKLWQRYKDSGLFEARIQELLFPFHLRQHRADRDAAFEFDASKIDIPSPRSGSSRTMSLKSFPSSNIS